MDDANPNRPPVGTTPLDDTPFVVEGSDKLPAGNAKVSYVMPRGFPHVTDAHK